MHAIFILVASVAIIALIPLLIFEVGKRNEVESFRTLYVANAAAVTILFFLTYGLGSSSFATDSWGKGGVLARGQVLKILAAAEVKNGKKETMSYYTVLQYPDQSVYSYRLDSKPPEGCFLVTDREAGTVFESVECKY